MVQRFGAASAQANLNFISKTLKPQKQDRSRVDSHGDTSKDGAPARRMNLLTGIGRGYEDGHHDGHVPCQLGEAYYAYLGQRDMYPKVKSATRDSAEQMWHKCDPMEIGEMSHPAEEVYEGERGRGLRRRKPQRKKEKRGQRQGTLEGRRHRPAREAVKPGGPLVLPLRVPHLWTEGPQGHAAHQGECEKSGQ